MSDFPRQGLVIRRNEILLAAPDNDAQQIAKLKDRQPIAILQRQSEWTHIELEDGRRGWISSNVIGVMK